MQTKASNIIILKKILKEHPAEKEAQLLESLSPTSREQYEKVVATSWIPQKEDSEIKLAAAKILDPQNPFRARDLQRRSAVKGMNSIYKVFLRIPSVPAVLRFTAQLWKTFWKSGAAHVEQSSENSVTIVVTDFPELIPEQMDLICGYMMGILDMTKTKKVQASYDTSNPNEWKWHFTWEL